MIIFRRMTLQFTSAIIYGTSDDFEPSYGYFLKKQSIEAIQDLLVF